MWNILRLWVKLKAAGLCYSFNLISVFTDPESVQKIHPASNDCFRETESGSETIKLVHG